MPFSTIVYKIIKMEEYRRKYLTPTSSLTRNSSYMDSVQKDKSVSELRRDLHECKQMQQKFDDLCLDIVKLERQNKKIESQQSLIESEYIEKIKGNKSKITKLKQEVLDWRENIENWGKKIGIMESQSDKLESQIERIVRDEKGNSKDRQEIGKDIEVKEGIKKELKSRIDELKQTTKQANMRCQEQTEMLDYQYQELKKNQVQLRMGQESNEAMKKAVQDLSKQRQMWQKKLLVSESQVNSANSQLELNKQELSKKEIQCLMMMSNDKKCQQGYVKTKSDIKKMVLENRELANQLANAQIDLFGSSKSLQKDQGYLQKMSVKEMELKKTNQRLQEMLKVLTETVQDEHESYSRIIGHMKQSIQKDQKAIEGLVKQATQLQTMIN